MAHTSRAPTLIFKYLAVDSSLNWANQNKLLLIMGIVIQSIDALEFSFKQGHA